MCSAIGTCTRKRMICARYPRLSHVCMLSEVLNAGAYGSMLRHASRTADCAALATISGIRVARLDEAARLSCPGSGESRATRGFEPGSSSLSIFEPLSKTCSGAMSLIVDLAHGASRHGWVGFLGSWHAI